MGNGGSEDKDRKNMGWKGMGEKVRASGRLEWSGVKGTGRDGKNE